jgi:putative pyruvate formate lyase activating enzyme
MEEMAENFRFAEETASLIVRHLLLPGHLECCVLPMLDWLKKNLDHPRLSLRKEYIPPEKIKDHPSLSGYILEKDFNLAVQAAEEKGIELVP